MPCLIIITNQRGASRPHIPVVPGEKSINQTRPLFPFENGSGFRLLICPEIFRLLYFYSSSNMIRMIFTACRKNP